MKCGWCQGERSVVSSAPAVFPGLLICFHCQTAGKGKKGTYTVGVVKPTSRGEPKGPNGKPIKGLNWPEEWTLPE
jgi:hypothetical protein